MRLAFAGTPAFAVAALDALHAAGHDIAAVHTQPDRPAGRGRRLQATPVAERAAALGLPVHKPAHLDAAAIAALRELAPEALVVVAYGLILPEAALAIPRHGCFNIHASLLPRWRGAAPIQRAILAGDATTGITIMRMDRGLDTGPMLLQEALPIPADATAGELHDRLAPLGAQLMVEALDRLAHGALAATPQPADGASYARKVAKEEARLDWTQPAAALARAVRAFNPSPVAWSVLDPGSESGAGGERVRILRARATPAPSGDTPGSVLGADDGGIRVATGDGTLVVAELQFPGGRALAAPQAAARSWAGRHFA